MIKSLPSVTCVLLIAILTLSSTQFSTPIEPAPIEPYLNGNFSDKIPGASGSLQLTDPWPEFNLPSPLKIIAWPTEDSEILVLTKGGELWQVSFANQTKRKVLDISDRTFALGDGGAVGIALHPHFGNIAYPDKQFIFIYYRTKPKPKEWTEEGYNRLSKFSWNEEELIFDPSSEEILIQQYDRCTWHNGGGMFFDPQGYLNIAFGDEGKDEFQSASTQCIDGGFFSGLIRIDIDNDPSRSHSIKRQPQVLAKPIKGWDWQTFSQGYSIPNDNPWVTSDTDSTTLEEFYALGIRSPYTITYDPEGKRIWMADVGSNKREEITLIERGDNLQWPYYEGFRPSDDHEKPTTRIGKEKSPYFEYERDFGTCIIGGDVYRGSKFIELEGKYLFADYSYGKVMALSDDNDASLPEVEVLISNLSESNVDLPYKPGITGLFTLPDGEIMITVISDDKTIPGKIYKLSAKEFVPDPPHRLSELGVFTDLENLTPIGGLIPYDVNAPLWSDGAMKKRWMAIPNNGEYKVDEQINFKSDSEWTFPEGTVFVKHFELILDRTTGTSRKLETRFFVVGKENQKYGVTYKWNDEQTDAFLTTKGSSDDFDIFDNGEYAYSQTWDYPSRAQCMSCHNANANFVLGVNTHQLNRPYDYPNHGEVNQLDFLNQMDVFNSDIGSPQKYAQTYNINDTDVDMGQRVRSYLDSNCAPCHRPGGVKNVVMDLRHNVPLPLQGIINQPTKSHASNADLMIVEPGAHASSELWVRDASIHENRMPPISSNLLDEKYLDILAKWIDSLSDEEGTVESVFIYPNPSQEKVIIRLDESWPEEVELNLWSLHGALIRKEVHNTKSIILDVLQNQSGIYLLELNAENKHLIRQLVVK